MPRCPSCGVPMTRVESGTLRAHTCSNCFGTWVNATALRRQVRGELEEQGNVDGPGEASLGDLVAVVAESNTKKELRCPECAKPMKKDRFHSMIPVTVDVCRKCERMWLDAGEMSLLKKLYKEMATSDDPKIVRLREKVAMVNNEMATRKTALDTAQDEANNLANGFDLVGGIIRALMER